MHKIGTMIKTKQHKAASEEDIIVVIGILVLITLGGAGVPIHQI